MGFELGLGRIGVCFRVRESWVGGMESWGWSYGELELKLRRVGLSFHVTSVVKIKVGGWI